MKMEAPNIFSSYGKIADLDLTDYNFHIDDLLNFSNEEIAGPIGDDDDNNNKKWANDMSENSSTQRRKSPAYGNYDAETEEHYTGTQCSDDFAQLEWLSNFADDSFSVENSAPEPPNLAERPPNHNEEIGSSFSPEMCSSTVPGRARSKRPRRPPVSNWYNSHILLFNTPRGPSGLDISSHTNSSVSANAPRDQCHAAEIATPSKKFAKTKRYGTTRLKKTRDESRVEPQTTRRCMHCAIQRTPQWRAGPMGPKTLCNACGVRYKSGRLLPEYRPAASPTFVLTQHSNSHKKVLQMRRQKVESEQQQKGHGFRPTPTLIF